MESVAEQEAGHGTGSRASLWMAEGLSLAVVVGLVLIKLATVSGGSWRPVLLANGDSLVLPLLMQSFERGEPFDWIFSSQTFFFPEFPLYALCSVLTGSPQAALVLNAVLNVVLLYLGIRAITAVFAPGQRIRQLAVALGATVLFLIAMLSEAGVRIIGLGTVEPTRITTVLLMTTYYGGALLVSLGMLALAFWVTRRFQGGPSEPRRNVVYLVTVILVGAAVSYSDPLYLVWYLAPLGLALLVMLVRRRITLRWALIVIAPQIVGLGIGMLARAVLSRFIAASFDHYVASYGVSGAVSLLGRVAVDWLSSPDGILRLLVLIIPGTITVVFLAGSLRRRAATAQLFLAVFIACSTITLLAVQIVTGQSVTRYLLPLFVFPPLALLLVPSERFASRLAATSRRVRVATASLVAIAVVVAVGISAPAVADLASPRSPVDTACLDQWLQEGSSADQRPDGVGSFWTVRALELYGHHTGRLVQVVAPMNVHAWMTNLADYDDPHFSYAIVDAALGGDELRRTLGAPAQVVSCSGFQIYDYAGTAGEATLNSMLRSSLDYIRLHGA